MSGTRSLLVVPLLVAFGWPAVSFATEVFWILPPPTQGDWQSTINWSTSMVPGAADRAHIDNNGTALISSGNVNVLDIVLGETLSGNILQSDGTVTTSLLEVGVSSTYKLDDGTLQISNLFSLDGTLDLSLGNGSIIAEDNAVIDFSLGSLVGGGNATFDGGIGSTLFLPAGVDPNDLFSSFNTLGEVFNVSGSVLVVPSGFTLDITSDRPDLIRVEGILQPAGSPASPQPLTFSQGGVEVAPGGLFDMHGANLTLRTDSSVTGGELRDVGTLTIADQTDNDVTFTQTSGMTEVNGSIRVGYATSSSSNPRGTLNMNGGSLSISSLSVATATRSDTFPEGTFQQMAGTTTVGGPISVASVENAIGAVELLGGTLTNGGNITVATAPTSEGTLVIGGATLDVAGDVTIGRSAGNSMGQLTQSGGDFSLNSITVHPDSQYDLTGGTLSIADRFDLTGNLNFGSGNATITLDDEGVVDWSQGTLLGSAAGMTYTAGVDSESYFPAGFDPNVEFGSFSSQGLVHTQGTTLVVPVGFTMNITADRPDLTRVEGVLRPAGSPASPQALTFSQGGVEVPPGGLFNLFGANLTLRTDSSVTGGEIRNIGTFTIGDVSGEHHTFTQTSGMTDVNGSVRVGYATSSSSNPRGTLNMDGGNLSISSSLSVGTATRNDTFSEGTFRQTAGVTTVGSSLFIANQGRTTGSVELLGGIFTVGSDLHVAGNQDNGVTNAEGTLVIGGGTLDVAEDVIVGRAAGNNIGQLTQSGGDFSLDAITVHAGSQYDLTGGTLSIADRFDLTGTLNFGSGNATINVADEGVVEWSTGTLTGSPSNVAYFAGLNSESYFPTGFNPYMEFASFRSDGLVHSTNTVILIPVTFSGHVFRLTADNLVLSGAVVLEPGGLVNASSVTLNGGSISGEGTVNTGSFVNSGIVAPGEDVATLTISGPYEQTSLGTLEVDLGGFLPGTSHDLLEITGAAVLDGSLSIDLVDGFAPAQGASFTILTAMGITGEFASIDTVSPLPAGLAWNVIYGADAVSIEAIAAGLAGDYNQNGIVDTADYPVWLAALGSNNLPNQGASPGIVDIEDYNFWKANFGNTLGSGSSNNAQVPEPSALTLWLAISVALTSHRRYWNIRNLCFCDGTYSTAPPAALSPNPKAANSPSR